MPATSIDGVRVANFTDLDATTLYELLRLRVDVFVVEQQCPYPELDGRDTESTTRHLWLPDPHRPGSALAYLRVLTEPGQTTRIGRVAVAPRARGAGLARRLMTAALALVYHQECVLDAQLPLVDFYQQYGFAPTGPEYLEDGIPHIPMLRAARPPVRPPNAAGR